MKNKFLKSKKDSDKSKQSMHVLKEEEMICIRGGDDPPKPPPPPPPPDK